MMRRALVMVALWLVGCGAPKAAKECRPADCDDGNVCTSDVCTEGECAYTDLPIDLTPEGLCSIGTCDPVLGVQRRAVSTDDANACTVDACDPRAGVSHTPVPVDDGDPLTTDACDPATGTITHRCSDTVTSILPRNPGADAGAYPAPGWYSDDTRANGSVAVDRTLGAPAGFGCTSAMLTTGASTTPGPSADKAQLISFAKAGVELSSITTIGYWSLRSSTSTGGPIIALSLNVSITGPSVPTGFATLVFEPYRQSGGPSAIQLDVWQRWNATATTPGDGLWWTNRIANGPAPGTPGSQSNPQPWAAFQALYPGAKVLGYGFNVGSANPSMVVGGDGLVFGDVTTDF